MQNIHDYSMTGARCGGGSTGQFFGGDRRMRVHQNNILNHHHQSLNKCPRCNSLNTKFCYYNNYNHSQPRHFCKNCRRYWTKGGVLRNVPVGGGCRKAKRSKSNQPPSSSQEGEEKPSSSESSSSLTVSTSTVMAVTATAAAARVTSSVGNGTEWSTLLGQGDGGVFSEMRGFTVASSIETTAFRREGSSVNQQCVPDHLKLEGNIVHQQLEDPTAQVDPSMGLDQRLFDLTSTVDHAYWSYQDHYDLYLPHF